MVAIDPYGWRVLQHMVVTGQAHPELLGAMQAALAPQLSTILSANNGLRLFQGMTPPLSLSVRCCAHHTALSLVCFLLVLSPCATFDSLCFFLMLQSTCLLTVN